MNLKLMIVGAALAMGVLAAHADELTLFGQPLESVQRADLKSAAKSNGAHLLKSNAAEDIFDASRLGLPGAQTLEIVYLNGQMVMAQYKFQKFSQDDERLRKMIIAKYGYPKSVTSAIFTDFNAPKPSSFDWPFIREGMYHWPFDNDMEMVFTKDFFGDRYLTYVNRTVQAQMKRALDSADKNGAAQDATAKQNLF